MQTGCIPDYKTFPNYNKVTDSKVTAALKFTINSVYMTSLEIKLLGIKKFYFNFGKTNTKIRFWLISNNLLSIKDFFSNFKNLYK